MKQNKKLKDMKLNSKRTVNVKLFRKLCENFDLTNGKIVNQFQKGELSMIP